MGRHWRSSGAYDHPLHEAHIVLARDSSEISDTVRVWMVAIIRKSSIVPLEVQTKLALSGEKGNGTEGGLSISEIHLRP
jgi:hypothetical protein